MARQNYFIGGIVGPITKAIGGSIISTLIGGGKQAAGGGGGSDSAMAFLKMSEDSAVESSRKFAEIKSENNAAAAPKNCCYSYEYLQEKQPREKRQEIQEKLYNTSMYRLGKIYVNERIQQKPKTR